MSSYDDERNRKLNAEFDQVFQEHERLREDLSRDQSGQQVDLLAAIDKWEQDAIRKIKKTADTARQDVERLLKKSRDQLKHVLRATVTEELQEALKRERNDMNEMDISRWMASLSDMRRQAENLSSTITFVQNKMIHLIKVQQQVPRSSSFQSIDFNRKEFSFQVLRGDAHIYKAQNLISTTYPAAIASNDHYSKGTHYFRFRVEQAVDELFFGIIGNTNSVYGWWNIDRKVVDGKKQPYVSTLKIHNGDEVILAINCFAKEIFLEYPSMNKLNSLKTVNDRQYCPLSWRILIESGTLGQCFIRLIEWGIVAHGANCRHQGVHCYCRSNK